MIVIGINSTTNAEGVTSTTFHVADDFDSYFNNPEAGRHCSGQKVDSIFVGNYDCSAIKIGNNIEVMYDRAIPTKNGFFQPVKEVVVVK